MCAKGHLHGRRSHRAHMLHTTTQQPVANQTALSDNNCAPSWPLARPCPCVVQRQHCCGRLCVTLCGPRVGLQNVTQSQQQYSPTHLFLPTHRHHPWHNTKLWPPSPLLLSPPLTSSVSSTVASLIAFSTAPLMLVGRKDTRLPPLPPPSLPAAKGKRVLNQPAEVWPRLRPSRPVGVDSELALPSVGGVGWVCEGVWWKDGFGRSTRGVWLLATG